MTKKTIVWFRQDLRIHDSPALYEALNQGEIIPIYILDDAAASQWRMGGASKWWLHHSLDSLAKTLQSFGHTLHLFQGDSLTVLQDILNQTNASHIVWNRCYEPEAIKRDTYTKETLIAKGVNVQSYNASLLFEPWTVQTQQSGYFKVFTPFWKQCLKMTPDQPVASKDLLKQSSQSPISLNHTVTLDELKLLPTHPNWAKGFEEKWILGEGAALKKFQQFLHDGIEHYKTQRDFMDRNGTSLLSPHLHFGEISPRYIWHACQELLMHTEDSTDIHHFLSEIGWREFSYHLLYHVPHLPGQPFKEQFAQFQWLDNPEQLRAWQKGQTGIPIVDAAMRELWHTGYMHNRARMIVASFLTKNLLIHWRHGAEWFWDTLVDADLANNSASWQWVAGSGVDAAPYFRIFNPVTQGEKFDPNGDYVKTWVPELQGLDVKYIHQPWEAPVAVLKSANIQLGGNYPNPIADLKTTRNRALNAYDAIK